MKNIKKVLFILFACCSLAKAQTFPSNSLYQLTDSWVEHTGKKVKLSEMHGEISLVAMIFSSCPSACPLIVSDIKSIVEKMDKKVQKKIKVRLFSFDDEVDTPEQLKKFYEKHKLDSSWTLYSGDKMSIANLAAALEVQYKRLAKGSFAHSNQIFLVGDDGVILSKIHELGDDPAALIEQANNIKK